MRAAEITPAHYLGHLGLPSYPLPAVGPTFKMGRACLKFGESTNFAPLLNFGPTAGRG